MIIRRMELWCESGEVRVEHDYDGGQEWIEVFYQGPSKVPEVADLGLMSPEPPKLESFPEMTVRICIPIDEKLRNTLLDMCRTKP